MYRVTFPEKQSYYDEENLKIRLKILKNKITTNELTINDIFEMKAISLWLVKDPKKDVNSIKSLNICVKNYFNNHSIDDICNEIKENKLEYIYQHVFWNEFSKKDISFNDMEKLLSACSDESIKFPLKYEKITKKHCSTLKKIIIKNTKNIDLFIGNNDIPIKNTNFLSKDDKSSMIQEFINNATLDDCNELEKIQLSKNANDKEKLLAKHKVKELESKITPQEFQEIKSEISIKLLEDSLEDNRAFSVIIDKNCTILHIYVNKNILDENLKKKISIINNIKTILQYISSSGIICFSGLKSSNLSLLEILTTIPNSNDIKAYNPSFTLRNVLPFGIEIFSMYCDYLKKNNISLEETINWYFEKYICKEYKINGLNSYLPCNNPYDDINKLLAQLHRLLKIIDEYGKDNNFDRELIYFSSETPRFKDLKSVLNDKYVSITDPVVLCFQSFVYANNNEKDNNFAENLKKGKVKYNNLNVVSKTSVDNFANHNLLKIKDNKVIVTNPNIVDILGQSYQFGVISKYSLRENGQELVDNLVHDNKAKYINKLLTPGEADFFDYVFSDTFSDSLGIRNRYQHGTYPSNPSTVKKDYFFTLMMINLLVVKFNDDLIQRKRIFNNDNTESKTN